MSDLRALAHSHPAPAAMLALVAAIVVTATAYLAKSAAGIDLMPGPSPLHDFLYPILNRR